MSYYTYGLKKYARALPSQIFSPKLQRFFTNSQAVKQVPKALSLRKILYPVAAGSAGLALGNTMFNTQNAQQFLPDVPAENLNQ